MNFVRPLTRRARSFERQPRISMRAPQRNESGMAPRRRLRTFAPTPSSRRELRQNRLGNSLSLCPTLTPIPPPFLAMNSTPALGSLVLIFEQCSPELDR